MKNVNKNANYVNESTKIGGGGINSTKKEYVEKMPHKKKLSFKLGNKEGF